MGAAGARRALRVPAADMTAQSSPMEGDEMTTTTMNPLEGLVEGPSFTETFVFEEQKRSTNEFHSTQPDKERRLFSFDGRLWLRQHSADTAVADMEVPVAGVRITVEYFGKPA